MRLSIVIPIYNERENIRPLYEALAPVLSRLGQSYEVIFVNDGSQDGSAEALEELAFQDRAVKLVHFRRNFGQTAALAAGIHASVGDVIVTMDGDLQNDPADIPMMLAKLDEGYDLVHGWRKNRQDALVNRRLPSKIANGLIARVARFPVHDLGCTLKAIRREIAQDLRLYGEMHRFIPVLAHGNGARCVEVVTRHHARKFGHTKYGIGRTFRVILDLLTVRFLTRHLTSPMKLLGGAGLAATTFGLACGSYAAALALVRGGGMGLGWLLVAGFSLVAGIQLLGLGLLGELASRTYYESQDKRAYSIRRTVNFGGDELCRPRAA